MLKLNLSEINKYSTNNNKNIKNDNNILTNRS